MQDPRDAFTGSACWTCWTSRPAPTDRARGWLSRNVRSVRELVHSKKDSMVVRLLIGPAVYWYAIGRASSSGALSTGSHTRSTGLIAHYLVYEYRRLTGGGACMIPLLHWYSTGTVPRVSRCAYDYIVYTRYPYLVIQAKSCDTLVYIFHIRVYNYYDIYDRALPVPGISCHRIAPPAQSDQLEAVRPPVVHALRSRERALWITVQWSTVRCWQRSE